MPQKSKPWRRRSKVLLLMAVTLLGLAIFLGVIRWPSPQLGVALSPSGSIAHPEVAEASGLVQSATHPERLWLHNDSGDWPRIFAMNIDGTVIVPEEMARRGVVARAPSDGESLYPGIAVKGAKLVDWEDITRCGDQLFIAEMGNNLNARQDLGVYWVAEPDPTLDTEVEAKFLPVRYPDQQHFPPLGDWNFDCEAIFCWQDKLYFVTKTRPAFRVYIQGSSAALYRLDSMHTDQVNTLTRVDQVANLGGWVTAADTSQDGQYLALLIESPVQGIWLYQRPAEGDRFFSNSPSVKRFIFHKAGQLESLAFVRSPEGEDEIVILNEEREIFHIPLASFTPVTP